MNYSNYIFRIFPLFISTDWLVDFYYIVEMYLKLVIYFSILISCHFHDSGVNTACSFS